MLYNFPSSNRRFLPVHDASLEQINKFNRFEFYSLVIEGETKMLEWAKQVQYCGSDIYICNCRRK